MVFPKIVYRHRGLHCGTSGTADDLVASSYDARVEDRAHDHDPCAQLDIVPINAGIHSNNNGVLQAA